MRCSYGVALFGLLVLPALARADMPSPRLDRILPLGAAAGSTVELEAAGADLEDANTLFFDHPGITAQHLKDRKFTVTVAANVPPGTYDARLVGRFGISNPRLFAVSNGFAEITEKEPNDEAATAQVVPMNSIINGNSDSGRDDVFRFPAKKGQRVVIECFAQRLDSRLDATLVLTDTDGRQLAANGDYAGRDPLVEFVAPRDGDYLVIVNDLSYQGGHPYRLLISDRPHVENVFPRAVQVGKPATLTVFGRNLGTGAKPSPLAVNDLSLDTLTETVLPPNDLLSRSRFQFTEHPSAHSVLPTAATFALTGFQHRGVPLFLTDSPVTLEQEPNDDPEKPQKLTLPVVLSGRFDIERDADWYEIEPTETGTYAFEVYCERIAGRADPYLVVKDEKENRIAELDDFGPRVNAFDGHIRDVSGTTNLTAKKKYRVLVQDRYRRGGARYQYVLAIRKAEPDFAIAVIHHQNPGPGGTTIRRGGATYLDVVMSTFGGSVGPVTITASGLPKGLHAAPTVLHDSRGVFVLWADADAPDSVGPIQLTATAKRGEETITRDVRPYTRIWNQANIGSSRPTRELFVAVRESAPFAVTPTQDRIELEAGKKVELKVKCERRWPEFKSAVSLTPLAFPGPVKASAVNLPENQTEIAVPLEVQANARPGEYTLTLQCQAQVLFSKDPKATAKPNTLVAVPSRPFTLVILPTKKK